MAAEDSGIANARKKGKKRNRGRGTLGGCQNLFRSLKGEKTGGLTRGHDREEGKKKEGKELGFKISQEKKGTGSCPSRQR